MKTLWKKPELIVLYRGQPEEHLLDVCKSVTVGGGALRFHNKCDQEQGNPLHAVPCGGCHAQPPQGGS